MLTVITDSQSPEQPVQSLPSMPSFHSFWWAGPMKVSAAPHAARPADPAMAAPRVLEPVIEARIG
jgi:hypothetical protein